MEDLSQLCLKVIRRTPLVAQRGGGGGLQRCRGGGLYADIVLKLEGLILAQSVQKSELRPA